TLVGFTGLMRFVYRPFRRFTASIKIHAKSLVALERVVEILQQTTPASGISESPMENAEGRLTLRRVSFMYDSQKILHDLDLDLEANRLIAIVGKSGAGKSTLLRLLARLREPSSGTILLDGRDVSRLELASFRAHVAIVPQFPMIFTGTVAENMRIAKPDATDHEIAVACEAAGVLQCIDMLPQKFETLLGRDGIKLSGGEVQRLALARALLRQPKVLLLDEPTSALDAESKLAILAALQRLKNFMTIIVTSHELYWMRQSDHIVVLENGRIMASGTHETLISSFGAYRRLYDKKLIEFE
ncbi:MAG: ATP-binding cassette domain-containing protein, partial [bacterium]